MTKLTRADIVDLAAYELERAGFLADVIALKRTRRVEVGPFVSVVFENATTMRFQIQEMARAERMVSDADIDHQLEVYNALVPEPGELSITLLIELTSDEDLREWLPKLVGIERAVSFRTGDPPGQKVIEALPEQGHASQLTRDEITASVHYLKAQLSEFQARWFAAEQAAIVIDHPAYSYEKALSKALRESILADWATAE